MIRGEQLKNKFKISFLLILKFVKTEKLWYFSNRKKLWILSYDIHWDLLKLISNSENSLLNQNEQWQIFGQNNLYFSERWKCNNDKESCLIIVMIKSCDSFRKILIQFLYWY